MADSQDTVTLPENRETSNVVSIGTVRAGRSEPADLLAGPSFTALDLGLNKLNAVLMNPHCVNIRLMWVILARGEEDLIERNKTLNRESFMEVLEVQEEGIADTSEYLLSLLEGFEIALARVQRLKARLQA